MDVGNRQHQLGQRWLFVVLVALDFQNTLDVVAVLEVELVARNQSTVGAVAVVAQHIEDVIVVSRYVMPMSQNNNI